MTGPEFVTPRVALPGNEEAAEQQLKLLDRTFETLVLYATYARRGNHVYERGDVPSHVIARRRARNKVARVSRRKNR